MGTQQEQIQTNREGKTEHTGHRSRDCVYTGRISGGQVEEDGRSDKCNDAE